MNIRLRWLGLAMALMALGGCARRLKTPPPPAAFDGSYFRFATGLQLAVYEDPEAARVSVTVSYGVGALEDPAGREGMAHLVEHLTFSARPDGPADPTLDGRLFALGASEDAFTSFEETVYFASVPKDGLVELLRIEAARMRAPLANVTDEEFTAERKVVTVEHDLRDGSGSSGQVAAAMGVLFEGHPYGRPLIGTEQSVARIDLAQAKQWASSLYTPDSAVVVISGPVRPAEAKEALERAFGGLASGDGRPALPPSSRLPPEPPPPLAQPQTLKITHAGVATRELWLVWAAPGRSSEEWATVYGAASALERVLERQLRTDRRVREVAVDPWVLEGMSVVIARLTLAPGVDALQIHDDVLARFEIPSWDAWGTEFGDLVADGLAHSAYTALEGPVGASAAPYVRTARRSDFAAAWREKILAGIDHRVFEAARRYFPREQARAVLIVPSSLATAAGIPDGVFASPTGNTAADGQPPPASASSIMVDRTVPESFTLDNGLEVVVVRRTRLPRVNARLVVRTRPQHARDTPELAMLAAYSSGSRDLWGWRNGYLVSEHEVERDHLGNALRGMSSWVRNTGIPLRHDYLQKMFAKWLVEVWDEPSVRVAAFTPEHLLGQPRQDKATVAERLSAIQRSQTLDWLDRELRPQNARLILVGELPEQKKLRNLLNWEFMGWGNRRGLGELLGLSPVPPPSAAIQPELAPPPTSARVLLVPERAALAHIRVSVRGPALTLNDVPSWTVFGKGVETRLFRQLRRQLGVAYYVHAIIQDQPGAGILTLATSVRPEHATEVITHMRAILRECAQQPLRDEELRRAIWEAARHYDDGLATNDYVGKYLQWAFVHGGTPGWSGYPEALSSVDGRSVEALARKLAVGGEAITVTGNIATLEESLRAAGLTIERLRDPM